MHMFSAHAHMFSEMFEECNELGNNLGQFGTWNKLNSLW